MTAGDCQDIHGREKNRFCGLSLFDSSNFYSKIEASSSSSLNNDRSIVDIKSDCTNLDMDKIPIFVAAPMVRYSKLPFRNLVRLYSADLVYSPMIYAKNFIASECCRSSEFTTSKGDSPTIVQFASNDPVEFALATEFIYRYCAGVDLNCGCPKRDVVNGGYGSRLLSNPELISDIIAHTRRHISDPEFTISIKIRINCDIQKTIELCRQVERSGISFITVHGRTPEQRTEDPNYEAIKLIKSIVKIPIIANGGITSYQQAINLAKQTGVDGVMSANGLLENPAMFAGHDSTPAVCVQDWLQITAELGHSFDLFHQQLIFMLRSSLSVSQRTVFNELTSRSAVVDFLWDNLL